ncbi:MAG: helix-turn-helix transcriptional regulator [Lachnospiraceae bacterium]|nr:helix-turn-helix transcriptional regulator [Lachnospiraceae bacterium]
MTLADKLKEARKNVGLTQIELAEKLCVSRQAITKWETGGLRYNSDKLKKAL